VLQHGGPTDGRCHCSKAAWEHCGVKRALGAAWIERLLQDGNGSIEDACWPIYPGETFLLPAIHSFRFTTV